MRRLWCKQQCVGEVEGEEIFLFKYFHQKYIYFFVAGCLHLAAVLAPHQAGSEHLAAAEPRHAQLPGHGAAAGGRAAAAAGIQSQETLQQESGPAHHPRRGKQYIVIRDVWVWVISDI